MLIYDRFKTREDADRFSIAVAERFGRETWVCETQQESNRVDPFPFPLDPPIVLVERDSECTREDEIERLVANFGGTFAGT